MRSPLFSDPRHTLMSGLTGHYFPIFHSTPPAMSGLISAPPLVPLLSITRMSPPHLVRPRVKCLQPSPLSPGSQWSLAPPPPWVCSTLSLTSPPRLIMAEVTPQTDTAPCYLTRYSYLISLHCRSLAVLPHSAPSPGLHHPPVPRVTPHTPQPSVTVSRSEARDYYQFCNNLRSSCRVMDHMRGQPVSCVICNIQTRAGVWRVLRFVIGNKTRVSDPGPDIKVHHIQGQLNHFLSGLITSGTLSRRLPNIICHRNNNFNTSYRRNSNSNIHFPPLCPTMNYCHK